MVDAGCCCHLFFGRRSQVAVPADNAVAGLVDHFKNFMVAGFLTVVGIGNVHIAARIQLIHQQVYLARLELLPRQRSHVGDHVACQRIDLIVAVKIGPCDAPCPLPADVDAMQQGHLLR